MKREKDELADFFRSRLSDAESTVRDGFWEELNQGIATKKHQHRLLVTRLIGAASVLLVLAASSIAFLYISPQDELEEAFKQVAVNSLDLPFGDELKQLAPPALAQPVAYHTTPQQSALNYYYPNATEDTSSIMLSMSVRVSITSSTSKDISSVRKIDNKQWGSGNNEEQALTHSEQEPMVGALARPVDARKWALKMAVGTSFLTGKGVARMPITGELTVERKLNSHLAIEAGLSYTNLPSEKGNIHCIGIPLKMNVTLASKNKTTLYAVVGGIADKRIAGNAYNEGTRSPIQLALVGGARIDYKINDRLALFAEPTVSHYFSAKSNHQSLRNKRATNVNLACGLRMIY